MNNEQLQQQVAELMAWKKARESQQLTYPLDLGSIRILSNYFLSIVQSLELYYGGASGRATPTLITQQGTVQTYLTQSTTQSYTVASSIFTVQKYAYVNGDMVVVSTTDTQPSPLVLGTTYYVVSVSGLTFKLSATSGGSAITITTTGTGLQFIDYLI